MSFPKIKLGVTGGMGSGKSFVCDLLRQQGIPVFGCDAAAQEELHENKLLQTQIKQLVGDDVYDASGCLVKPRMREFLCSGPEAAHRLDSLVHPCVRQRMRRWASVQSGTLVAVECALLYEAGFDRAVDKVLVVTAPRDLRIERVMARDGLTRSRVEAVMSLQMSEDEKVRRADFVIQNDGISDLRPQIAEILAALSFF